MTVVEPESLWIAVTTLPDAETARRTAAAAVEAGAACAQIEAPVTSLYRWGGSLAESVEFRLVLKVVGRHLEAVRTAVLHAHPYEVPQWIELRADFVTEKYLRWAASVG